MTWAPIYLQLVGCVVGRKFLWGAKLVYFFWRVTGLFFSRDYLANSPKNIYTVFCLRETYICARLILPWESKTKQRMVFRMIHEKDSLPRGKFWPKWRKKTWFNTVDGRNPAPVAKKIIPLFTRLYTSQVVVWDF